MLWLSVFWSVRFRYLNTLIFENVVELENLQSTGDIDIKLYLLFVVLAVMLHIFNHVYLFFFWNHVYLLLGVYGKGISA